MAFVIGSQFGQVDNGRRYQTTKPVIIPGNILISPILEQESLRRQKQKLTAPVVPPPPVVTYKGTITANQLKTGIYRVTISPPLPIGGGPIGLTQSQLKSLSSAHPDYKLVVVPYTAPSPPPPTTAPIPQQPILPVVIVQPEPKTPEDTYQDRLKKMMEKLRTQALTKKPKIPTPGEEVSVPTVDLPSEGVVTLAPPRIAVGVPGEEWRGGEIPELVTQPGGPSPFIAGFPTWAWVLLAGAAAFVFLSKGKMKGVRGTTEDRVDKEGEDET